MVRNKQISHSINTHAKKHSLFLIILKCKRSSFFLLLFSPSVNHGIQCSICKIGNIQGFRYKCQKCSNFNMCQNCFWQGKTIDNHRTDHEVKEYSTNVSGTYFSYSQHISHNIHNNYYGAVELLLTKYIIKLKLYCFSLCV